MTDNDPTPVSQRPQATTAREFMSVIFRRRWVILGLFIATTCTVFVVAFITPTLFVSSGRVLYKPGEQASVLEPGRRVYSQWEQELGSEIELVKSFPVIEKARAILRKQADSTGRVVELDPRSVDAEVMNKSNVIAIGYTDRDPETAQRACGAIIQAYLEYRQSDLNLTYPEGFFDREVAGVQSRLEQLAQERLRYSTERDLVDVPEQKRGLLNRLVTLEQQRSTVTADLAEAQANMSAMRDLQGRQNIDLPIPANTVGMDVLQQLKQKVLDQEARVAALRERYRDESPEVKNAIETLETLREMLRREVASRLEVLDSRGRVLQGRQASLDAQIADLRTQLDAMPAKEKRINEIDSEVGVLKKRYQDLVEKSDLARVTENTSPTSIVLLLSPAGTARPTNARDYIRLALAPAFSLVVGVGLAFFLDGLDITVRTARHAEEAVELPVLATLSERRRRG